jgi:hypothetical protein
MFLHALAIYSLTTGNIVGRRAPTIVDARMSMPGMFWAYAGFMVFGSVVFDVILFLAWREFVRNREKK